VGEVTLQLERSPDGDWVVSPGPARAIPVENAMVEPALAALVSDDHQAVRDWVNEAVAATPQRWSAADARLVDTPVIDLIQHVQQQAGEAQLSASAAFTTDLTFGPGPITRADLATLYPYENTLMVLEVTGRQVREYLEHAAGYYDGLRDGEPVVTAGRPGYNFDMLAGVDYLVDLARPVGDRVIELSHRGEPVEDDQRFTLAVNSYRAEGAGGYTMLTGAPVLRQIDRSVRVLIEEYLAERGEIRHEDVHRRNWAHAHHQADAEP
jgi:2',3'-cyclic-nucleotide 2'-phosphodiesterase/3'-nucleotidase